MSDEGVSDEGSVGSTPLPDGEHPCLVVDAGAAEDGSIHLDLVLLDGDRKGDVVEVTAFALDRDELDLLGLPAVLAVVDGIPHVTIDD